MNKIPLGALLRLMMCSDPWPVSDNGVGNGQEELNQFANTLAQHAGFTDWIDAYHNIYENFVAELSAQSNSRCVKCENWIETVESICGTCGWNPKINDYGEGITSAQESKPFGYITAFAAKSLAELEGSILSVSLTVSGECNGLTDTPLYLAAPSVSAQESKPEPPPAWNMLGWANYDEGGFPHFCDIEDEGAFRVYAVNPAPRDSKPELCSDCPPLRRSHDDQ